jgi:phosphoenolpyruvate carboxykinase (ATP)
LAGTEVGITEPKAAFSACYGAPFMSQHPSVYARLLAGKMEQHETRCILLNTGWGGGPYGVGKRISIGHTRALLDAALYGKLDNVPTEKHPILGLSMPTECPGVPSEILNPRNTWQDKAAYDLAANKLVAMFQDNYEAKNFAALGIDPVM